MPRLLQHVSAPPPPPACAPPFAAGAPHALSLTHSRGARLIAHRPLRLCVFSLLAAPPSSATRRRLSSAAAARRCCASRPAARRGSQRDAASVKRSSKHGLSAAFGWVSRGGEALDPATAYRDLANRFARLLSCVLRAVMLVFLWGGGQTSVGRCSAQFPAERLRLEDGR